MCKDLRLCWPRWGCLRIPRGHRRSPLLKHFGPVLHHGQPVPEGRLVLGGLPGGALLGAGGQTLLPVLELGVVLGVLRGPLRVGDHGLGPDALLPVLEAALVLAGLGSPLRDARRLFRQLTQLPLLEAELVLGRLWISLSGRDGCGRPLPKRLWPDRRGCRCPCSHCRGPLLKHLWPDRFSRRCLSSHSIHCGSPLLEHLGSQLGGLCLLGLRHDDRRPLLKCLWPKRLCCHRLCSPSSHRRS
mmetsp:Transcript_137231/g.238643  ORF Transcript_137231/g.238643 Transcript_137231/m.238643 type:complete len:243 (-) Transcript_137231:526-1254(-)